MHSLYNALLAQHSRQLTPVRCAEQTIAQLHRYFEEVVLENNLSPLIVEGLPRMGNRSLRDLARIRDLVRVAHRAFFFVTPGDAIKNLPLCISDLTRDPVLLKRSVEEADSERFVVIADARFSALLVSIHTDESDGAEQGGDRVVWTFEPDVVYSALEYLMARVHAEDSFLSSTFSNAVRASMPKATSLQLTVSVTTKLARLLQEQAGREIAINRIAIAIRNSLDLSSVLKTTVNEVGCALGAEHCGLWVEGENDQPALISCYTRDNTESAVSEEDVINDINNYILRIDKSLKNYVVDGSTSPGKEEAHPIAGVPLIYQERFMGALLVRSDDPARIWQDSEILLLRTVADQVTVAVNHARLYAQMQQQALTDVLTGCFNRRSFEMQLERDLQLATRMRQPLSLVFLDIDNFKRVNDTFGHEAGDNALRLIADVIREELRGVDTAARYGGEEFAIILPQADAEGAIIVAERLRARIEHTQ
ncbi:MAG: sensor domain-containing diguanylate cyclase, partial [Pyrinomonadaceae bacterium]